MPSAVAMPPQPPLNMAMPPNAMPPMMGMQPVRMPQLASLPGVRQQQPMHHQPQMHHQMYQHPQMYHQPQMHMPQMVQQTAHAAHMPAAPPMPAGPAVGQKRGAAAALGTATQPKKAARSEPAPIPAAAVGWKAAFDPSSGCTYYQNATTGETAWSMPEVVPGLAGTTRQTVVIGDERSGVLSKGGIATVHAVGKIQDSDKQFWSTHDKDKPFSFTAGENLSHVKGWVLGVIGMKVGETRVLVIPPYEAYGKKGFKGKEKQLPRWNIPGDSTLHLTIELVSIRFGDKHTERGT